MIRYKIFITCLFQVFVLNKILFWLKCILSLNLYKIYFIAGNTWPIGNVKNCMLSSIFQRICNLLFHDWFSVFWQIESHFYKHCMVVGASIELVRYNVKNVISFSSLQKGEFSRLSYIVFHLNCCYPFERSKHN